ncbi:MAG: hypothetical protein U0269_21385 [Polyangiales bacterium]
MTYQVGPSRALRELTAVANMLNPGDVVEVDPGTYAAVRFSRAGSTAMPITIRGLVGPGGARPVVQNGVNTIELAGNNYVVENLDIRGGSSRCVFHHADNIVIRNTIVHDCPRQGILGADQDSGDLTLEFVEVHHCGGGTQDHQIYMATDEVAYPGSVFRMQHCYVHDANGGNAVKSRAERNEIYYNWIEGALYHELELIGPDPGGAPAGWTEATAREDSDVVGNVLRATGTFSIVRVGGDGTGQSRGRYRFVNNTFVSNMGGGAVMRVFDAIESIEMHNNVFFATGGTVNVSRQVEAMWVGGEVFEGANNWVMSGSTNVPAGFRGTITGASPVFANVAGNDLRPVMGSPLIDRGVGATTSPTGHAFARPLALPLFEPPQRGLALPGVAIARAMSGMIDIGARESVAASVPDAGAMPDASMPADSGVAPLPDVVVQPDVAVPTDTGVLVDAAAGMDVAVAVDASGSDSATTIDSSTPGRDGSSSGDSGASADGGSTPGAMTGCGCTTPARSKSDRTMAVLALAVAMTALVSRKRPSR